MVLTRASGVISGVRLWPFKIFGFGRFSKKTGTQRFLGSDFFEGLESHFSAKKSLCSPVFLENKHTNTKFLSVSGRVLARDVFGRQKSLGGLFFFGPTAHNMHVWKLVFEGSASCLGTTALV